MKHIETILVFISLLVCCISCKKDPDSVQNGQIIVNETDRYYVFEDSIVSVDLTGNCNYAGTVMKIIVKIGFMEDLSDAITVKADINGGIFSATIPELTLDTILYYQYIVYRYSEEFENEMSCKDDRIYTLSTHDLHFPTVTTKDVTFVSNTTAMGCGLVSNENNDIVERGFCWGTHSKPKVTDNYDNNFIGEEEMFVQMKALASGTTYYARAYAKNSVGITYASDEICFKTKSSILEVETNDPLGITENSATLSMKISVNISGTYSYTNASYGFLIGTLPRTNSAIPLCGNINNQDLNSLNKEHEISNLDYSTTYYYRAYIVDGSDTICGDLKFFTTLSSSQVPTGELNGTFSVSPTQQVQFSPGNLQYQASTNKWRFAHQQWDFIGESNENLSATYYGWIDLFGWGTSGYDHGAACYQPWSTSYLYSNYYAYGLSEYNLCDQTGLADWGSNPIYLGDIATEGWRTMTSEEWDYVLRTRNTSSGIRFAKARLNMVNGTDAIAVNGVILFPDDWINNGLICQPNDDGAEFSSNMIYGYDWWKEEYESKGAVFLPAAGRRESKTVQYVGEHGYYWTASQYDWSSSRNYYFYPNNITGVFYAHRDLGFSVRLVRSSN